jgi:hypothetical protein
VQVVSERVECNRHHDTFSPLPWTMNVPCVRSKSPTLRSRSSFFRSARRPRSWTAICSRRVGCAACGPACNGHTQSIIDWEIAQAFRTWRYDETERLEKIREHWLDKLCGTGRDTFFFAGNQHLHPGSFLVLGVFWPPKRSA